MENVSSGEKRFAFPQGCFHVEGYAAASRKEQKEFESLEAEILELEEKKSALEAKMSSGAKIDYEFINRQYNDLTAELEKKYARWEELGLLS